MNKVDNYKVFLIEQYRMRSGLPARKVYNLFKDRSVFEYIDQAFEAIHTLDTKLVLADIKKRLIDS